MKSNFKRKWKGIVVTTCILSLPVSYLPAQENLVLHYNRPAEFLKKHSSSETVRWELFFTEEPTRTYSL